MKRHAVFTSSMHISIHYFIYEPQVVLRVKGIVQIHHGLGEHAGRYEHFASFLASHGYVVVVSDFAGHGRSLIDFEQGYFGEHDGPIHLIEDMHRLQMIIREKYPDSPYFMLGTDLGSILIRQYMSDFGDFIEGALLLGTLSQVDFFYFKRIYLWLLKFWKGPAYKAQQYSRYIRHYLNKRVHMTNDMDWLTSDEDERKKFLVNSYDLRTVQGILSRLSMVTFINNANKRLPANKTFRVILRVGKRKDGTITVSYRGLIRLAKLKSGRIKEVPLEKKDPVYRRFRKAGRLLPAAFSKVLQPPKISRRSRKAEE